MDAERTQAWLAEYGELKVQRDAVAKRFDEDLPRLCLELVAIMEAVKSMNGAVSNLNMKAPSIAGYHLDRVDEDEAHLEVRAPRVGAWRQAGFVAEERRGGLAALFAPASSMAV